MRFHGIYGADLAGHAELLFRDGNRGKLGTGEVLDENLRVVFDTLFPINAGNV